MKKIIFILFAVVWMASCVKDVDPNTTHFQLLKEKEKVMPGTDRVSIEGAFSFEGKVDGMMIQLGKDAHLHGSDEYPVIVSDHVFSVTVDSLEAGTLYYYRYEVDYGAAVKYYTEIDSFRTLAMLPVVETLEVMFIDSTEFRVKCRVHSEGGDPVTERGVCWNDYGDPTIDDHRETHAEVGTGEYTCRLSGLPPVSTCYARAYARNSIGVSYGAVLVFNTGEELALPTVLTMEVSGVTTSAATCLCQVVDDGGAEIIERGACWSTRPYPDITSELFANGNGLGEYIVPMVGLEPNTTYYLRSYAKNSKGIGYGEELVFTTKEVLEPPLGATNALFSVSEDRQVWFSVGNLMYNASIKEWGFTETQYQYYGDGNSHVAEDYSGWIDLFGWGTSGFDHGAVCYQPWSTNFEYESYYAYGSALGNLFDQSGQADWGYGVSIGVEDQQIHPWRSLTNEEWIYLFHERSTSSGIRYVKAQVNGVNGVLLLPDDWSSSVYALNNINQQEASFTSNTISWLDFDSTIEPNGGVFLPAAGRRSETTVQQAGNCGYYWSSTAYSNRNALALWFDSDAVDPDVTGRRSAGFAVRLVWEVIR